MTNLTLPLTQHFSTSTLTVLQRNISNEEACSVEYLALISS
jgi:hypothetical protein